MRKLFWGCLAGGFAVAGAAAGVMYHGFRHPETMIGQCVVTAARIAAPAGTGAARMTEDTGPLSAGEAAEEGTVSRIRTILNKGDQALEDEVFEAAEQAPQSGVVEPPTAPITIHEEEPAPLVMPEPGAATIDKNDLTRGCQQEMPYADGNKQAEQPADETGAAPFWADIESRLNGDCCEAADFWQQVLEAFNLDLSSWWSEPIDLSAPIKTSEEIEGIHYQPSAGCPHTGQCPRMTPSCNPPAPPTPETGNAAPNEDNHHAALRKALKLKARYNGEDGCPLHPEVDTMEFRSSDAHLYDYKLAGPL
jgi:hypothetical protein